MFVEELENEKVESQEVEGDEVDLEDDVIQLINEDGETVDFLHVATIEFEKNWYVFFQPAEELADIDEDQVVIFKLEADENGDDLFVPIEDEALLDRVFEEFNRLNEEGCECGDDCECDHEHNSDCHCGEECECGSHEEEHHCCGDKKSK